MSPRGLNSRPVEKSGGRFTLGTVVFIVWCECVKSLKTERTFTPGDVFHPGFCVGFWAPNLGSPINLKASQNCISDPGLRKGGPHTCGSHGINGKKSLWPYCHQVTNTGLFWALSIPGSPHNSQKIGELIRTPKEKLGTPAKVYLIPGNNAPAHWAFP